MHCEAKTHKAFPQGEHPCIDFSRRRHYKSIFLWSEGRPIKVITNIDDMKRESKGLNRRGKQVVLVPTMGFFHEGHRTLMREGQKYGDCLVVSIFVNPTQFAPSEDFKAYPRDLDRDIRMAESVGVQVVFAPESEDVYDSGHETYVNLDVLPNHLCGIARPGHFRGVATVVTKLFAGIGPDRAYFGRKDAQQLVVVRRMTEDLSMAVDIVAGSTVREPDGLALSSRNTRLSPQERLAARALNAGLMAAADAAEAGERSGPVLTGLARSVLDADPLIVPEYVEMASQESATGLSHLDRAAFLAVAAVVGGTRLIDNVHFDPSAGGFAADRGIRMVEPSVLYQEV